MKEGQTGALVHNEQIYFGGEQSQTPWDSRKIFIGVIVTPAFTSSTHKEENDVSLRIEQVSTHIDVPKQKTNKLCP